MDWGGRRELLSLRLRPSLKDRSVQEWPHYRRLTLHPFLLFSSLRNTDCKFLFHHDLAPLPLSARTPNHIVKNLLESIGVDSANFGSHSARRGGVSFAVASGVEIRLIARHGNWKSDAIFMYVTETLQSRLSVSRAIEQNLTQKEKFFFSLCLCLVTTRLIWAYQVA